jgi:hypothetical protein
MILRSKKLECRYVTIRSIGHGFFYVLPKLLPEMIFFYLFYLKGFPEELFSVLRTIQLLRGLTVGMGLSFSCAQQWRPIAEEALLKAGRLRGKGVLICTLVISLLILLFNINMSIDLVSRHHFACRHSEEFHFVHSG